MEPCKSLTKAATAYLTSVIIKWVKENILLRAPNQQTNSVATLTVQRHYILVAQRFNWIQKIKGVEYQKLSTSLKHAKLHHILP